MSDDLSDPAFTSAAGPEKPHQAETIQRGDERAPPEGHSTPGTPREVVAPLEVNEPPTTAHRAEVGRQRDEPGPMARSAVSERADEFPDLAAHPDPVGVPMRSPDGAISVHLGDGEWEDIDRTPGAFTAVRLWPHHSSGLEDYRLYDHTGKQVAHADVIGADAHVANIEAEGGANALGIKALSTLQTKLAQDFPELTAIAYVTTVTERTKVAQDFTELTDVKGLRSSGAPPGRTQEVEIRPVSLAEHVDELRAELRGSLESGEREMIAAELKSARALLNEQDPFPTASVPRSDLAPTRPGSADVEVRRSDIDAAARLSAEIGLPYTPAVNGEFVAGVYREDLTTSSGRFAVIDNGQSFALVPWTPELDRHLGRHVSGVAKESGGIEWSFGRKRGIEI